MSKEKIQVAWLKRDLRTQDHWPLASLSQRQTPAIALYVLERDYWKQEYSSPSQLGFVLECLQSLQKNLERLGIPLIVLDRNDALEGFQFLSGHYEITEILAHQETGNRWTYDRDVAIVHWANSLGIPVWEKAQNCVVRGQKKALAAYRNFNGKDWGFWVDQPLEPIPQSWVSPRKILPSDPIPAVYELFGENDQVLRQKGGEELAHQELSSFLDSRCLLGEGYRKELSSPLHAGQACSRISPHLTWGSLSVRTAVQTAKATEPEPGKNRGQQIQSFLTRMLWRDQFIQKFEALDWMEYQSINEEAQNGREWNEELYTRWAEGTTGYPFIDACMRSLYANQWINFRARAMLVSFAAYGLRLPWQKFDPHLARNFLDYEPGIHYPQIQMQAGTTFGSPPRVYNPLKQSMEKDPQGDFIRKWVPELRREGSATIHLPNDQALHRRATYGDPIIPSHGLWKVMQGVAKAPKPKGKAGAQLELFC